ncbi:MAG: 6-carboxytetrahydropterin synthase [Planctomycetota bacterium]
MHRLSRQIRFSINPFTAANPEGANSFASNPPGEGLALFFALTVELAGNVEPDTGFVINVEQIDKKVRQNIVPIFARHIRDSYANGDELSLLDLTGLLKSCRRQLENKFLPAEMRKLTLALNPFRNITIDSENTDMVYFSEKFEFAAMHKLWNSRFSDSENFEIFGKCAHPTGHGHNYVIEVTVRQAAGLDGFGIGIFEETVNSRFVELVDHRNLNVDIEYFAANIPTIENIALFAWEKLNDKFENTQLHCVTIWETDKTSCSYYGN